jgi:linoleoyl-CoA desaturase
MRTEREALARLRQEIVERGWHRKAPFRVMFELCLNLTLALAGICIFVAYQDMFIRACAMILSTAGSIGVATNTHTSSHYATSDRRWVNELLTYFGYPVFLGLSACRWWHQHIVLHHPTPNVIGVDHGVDLSPWFARTREAVERSAGFQRFYYEHLQWLVFPLTLPLYGFNIQINGWISLIRAFSRTETRQRKHWLDLASLLLHYLVWLAIPMVFFTPLEVAGFYLLRVGLMGVAIFAVLAPAHLTQEAVCFNASQERDWALLQTATTVNFSTGPIGKLICSAVEYQIEHHLFPNLSYVYYPKLAPLVRDFCKEQGLPYRCYRWEVVLWKCLLTFRTPARVHDLKTYRRT